MFGRFFVMLLLVAVMAIGGLIWFDYLGLIEAKHIPPISWVYGWFFADDVRSDQRIDEDIDLDAERYAMRLEHLDLRKREMEQKEREIDNINNEIEQKAQELESRQKELDDRENSLKAQVEDAENKERNIEQNARYLTGMPPDQAVARISGMEDQDIIDVFRKTEELARAEGRMSLVSVWLSRMDPARAAELLRKMALRP